MRHAELEALLQQAVETGMVPGVVAAVTDRLGTVYQSAHGAANADTRRPLQTDSVFRVGSMAKIPTSLAVLMLEARGRIALDRPLADYLPGYVQPPVLLSFDPDSGAYLTRPATRTVTARQLLTHTSGYGYWFLDAPLLRLTGPVPDLLNPPFLMREPGEQFAYSTSIDVLGQVIEPLGGRSLEDYLQTEIFAPLGMTDSGYRPPADSSRLVSAHTRTATGFAARPDEGPAVPPTGGTGLYSTAGNYLRLLRLFLNQGLIDQEALVPAATITAMTRNQIGVLFAERQRTALPSRSNDFLFMDGSQKFGFGFMIETRDTPGGRAAGSYAWGGILNTYFWVDPHAGIGAVLMMQMAPFCDPACIELLRRFERAVYAAQFVQKRKV